MNAGDGIFATPQSAFGFTDVSSIALGDVNGDCTLDHVVKD